MDHDQRIAGMRHDCGRLAGVGAFHGPMAMVERDLELLELSDAQRHETTVVLLRVASHLRFNASHDAPPVISSALRCYGALSGESGLPDLEPFLGRGDDVSVRLTAAQVIVNVFEDNVPQHPERLESLARRTREVVLELLETGQKLEGMHQPLCANAFVACTLLTVLPDPDLVGRVLQAFAQKRLAAKSLVVNPLDEAAAAWVETLPARAAGLEAIARRIEAGA